MKIFLLTFVIVSCLYLIPCDASGHLSLVGEESVLKNPPLTSTYVYVYDMCNDDNVAQEMQLRVDCMDKNTHTKDPYPSVLIGPKECSEQRVTIRRNRTGVLGACSVILSSNGEDITYMYACDSCNVIGFDTSTFLVPLVKYVGIVLFTFTILMIMFMVATMISIMFIIFPLMIIAYMCVTVIGKVSPHIDEKPEEKKE